MWIRQLVLKAWLACSWNLLLGSISDSAAHGFDVF